MILLPSHQDIVCVQSIRFLHSFNVLKSILIKARLWSIHSLWLVCSQSLNDRQPQTTFWSPSGLASSPSCDTSPKYIYIAHLSSVVSPELWPQQPHHSLFGAGALGCVLFLLNWQLFRFFAAPVLKTSTDMSNVKVSEFEAEPESCEGNIEASGKNKSWQNKLSARSNRKEIDVNKGTEIQDALHTSAVQTELNWAWIIGWKGPPPPATPTINHAHTRRENAGKRGNGETGDW